MSVLSTAVRRFCRDILKRYPLLKKELAALEEEKQAINVGDIMSSTLRVLSVKAE